MLRLISSTVSNASRILVSCPQLSRNITLSHRLCLKEIRERQEGDTLYIEGVYVKSPREDLLLKTETDSQACPLCAANLLVNHTDVLIIKQFVDCFGKLLPRKITGLCRWQHRRMQYVLEMAVRAGLVKALLPPDEPVPKYQQGWRCFNSYYDENVIRPSRSEVRLQLARKYEEAYRAAKKEKDAHEAMLKQRSTRLLLQKK